MQITPHCATSINEELWQCKNCKNCMYFACRIYFCWILTFCLRRTREFASCNPLRKSLAFAFLCLHWQRYFWLMFVHAHSLFRGTPVWTSLIRQSDIIVTIVLNSFIALLELNHAESLSQQVKISLQSVSNVTGGRQGHKYKIRTTMTVIEGMTVFSNLHLHDPFCVFKALFSEAFQR